MFLEKFKQNWKSGLTVSLVSIPLSISLAVASDATPIDGIITAIWAGLIAAIFGGSNFNIVGPTGALSGLLAMYAAAHGADQLSILAIAAGIIVLVAYALKLERYLVFVPASSIHGFTLGVAFIIAFNQFNFATGLSNLTKHEKFVENLYESFVNIGSSDLFTVAVFAFFLLGLFALLKYVKKIPAVIALTPLGILLGYLSESGKIPFSLQTLGGKFGEINAVLFERTHFDLNMSILMPALTVALVAILETMLSAKIADGMTKTKHDKRKEMLGLGLANLASGFSGGIPATAALARTALNIKSGATHKTSAGISSVAVLIISLILLSTFKYIPLAVIAAILVFTAARMVEMHHFIRMYKLDRNEFFLSLVVAFVTVYEDPMIGILFGTACALLIFVHKLSQGHYELVVNDENKQKIEHFNGKEKIHLKKGKADTLVYSIKGILAYINAQSHIGRFEGDLGACKNVVLRLRELYFMDTDGIDALEEIIQLSESKGKKVYITGVSPLIEPMISQCKSFNRLKKNKLVYNKTSEALTDLGFPL
jgi:SulP family sulfate permease